LLNTEWGWNDGEEAQNCRIKSLGVFMVMFFPVALVLVLAIYIAGIVVCTVMGCICGPCWFFSSTSTELQSMRVLGPLLLVVTTLIGLFYGVCHGGYILVEVIKYYWKGILLLLCGYRFDNEPIALLGNRRLF
jgi:hypothetical protein